MTRFVWKPPRKPRCHRNCHAGKAAESRCGPGDPYRYCATSYVCNSMTCGARARSRRSGGDDLLAGSSRRRARPIANRQLDGYILSGPALCEARSSTSSTFSNIVHVGSTFSLSSRNRTRSDLARIASAGKDESTDQNDLRLCPSLFQC